MAEKLKSHTCCPYFPFTHSLTHIRVNKVGREAFISQTPCEKDLYTLSGCVRLENEISFKVNGKKQNKKRITLFSYLEQCFTKWGVVIDFRAWLIELNWINPPTMLHTIASNHKGDVLHLRGSQENDKSS